jgi:hypothetical protein
MRHAAFALVLGLLVHTALADPIRRPAAVPEGQICQQAIVAAARIHGVPPALMAAIGRVESGRRDPVSGALHSWPWTVDANGQGSFYDSKPQAMAAVRDLQAHGTRSIDIGCMQVNLMHHPQAFATLDQAFDPAANADYAARFLVELHDQTRSWPRATALYHSTTPALAAAYEQKVMQAWPLEERQAAGDSPFTLARGPNPILGPVVFPPPRQNAGPRIIPRTAATGAAGSPGRGLAFYRAAPIVSGWRRPGG